MQADQGMRSGEGKGAQAAALSRDVGVDLSGKVTSGLM